MTLFGTMQIETLNKDNFETWQVQMKALLLKNDACIHASGSKQKPEIVEGDAK